jgi:lipid II:glycine glycyltransferase (peptidoglycan interpeptide bridge formation enzyme)
MITIINETFSPTKWNILATHPMQSWEWGEVRKNEGKKIVRFVEYGKKEETKAIYLMTIHPLPFIGYSIGYIPKSTPPSKEFLSYLKSYAQQNKIIFVKLEPNALSNLELGIWNFELVSSSHPLFTPWNQLLDISLSEQDLLKNMHPKTRYNVRLAEKKGVQVHEMTSEEGYQIFERLYFETCARQKYHGHTRAYHQNIWRTLSQSSDLKPYEPYELYKPSTNILRAHILIAFYKDVPLAAYQLWHFKDTLFYVYGGSSDEYKNVMAANLLMWEAIRLAKKLGSKTLDMWGSLPPTYDTKDPWAGFTKFKQGYGTKFVQYAGSYDLLVNRLLYKIYTLAQSLRQKLIL